jgi:hypothetical protein
MSDANLLLSKDDMPTYGKTQYAHVESSLIAGLESQNLAWAPSHAIYTLSDGPVIQRKRTKERTYTVLQVENEKKLVVDGVARGHYQLLQVKSFSSVLNALYPFPIYERAEPNLWRYLTEQQKIFLGKQSAVLVRTYDLATVLGSKVNVPKSNIAQPGGLEGLSVPCDEQSRSSTPMKLPPGTLFAYFDISKRSSYIDKTGRPPPLRHFINGELEGTTRTTDDPKDIYELRQIDNIDDILEILDSVQYDLQAYIVPETDPSLRKDQQFLLSVEGSYLVMRTEIGTEVHRRQKEREEDVQHASSAGSINRPATA